MTDEIVQQSVADLAARANREHKAVTAALAGAIQHALIAGAALAEAHERVEAWAEWCKGNLSFDRTTANWYIRIHRYREELGKAGVNSIGGAMRFLREHELSQRRVNDENRQQIVALLGEGLPQYEVAKRIGVSQSTVSRHAIARKRQRSRKVPRWLTHRRPRSGGKWDKAYSYFRQSLGEVAALAPNGDPRYDELYEHLYWIEDFYRRKMRGRHTGHPNAEA